MSDRAQERYLVTGGAGFIGSHLVDALRGAGHTVFVLDPLAPESHPSGEAPAWMHDDVPFVKASTRDRAALRELLPQVDGVFHLGALVGGSQAQYEIEKFYLSNVCGTAALVEEIASLPEAQRPRRLVVASSMAIYGEGAYRCPRCGPQPVSGRDPLDLGAGVFEPTCPQCRGALNAEATSESHVGGDVSIYALTKRAQEQLCMTALGNCGVESTALRFFGVYGPRQSLTSPYSGLIGTFLARILSGRAPVLFEDGLQSRQMIFVHDVVRACRLAMTAAGGAGRSFNITSPPAMTLRQIAAAICRAAGSSVAPEVSGRYRKGDIRHCVGDPAQAGRWLGFKAQVPFEQGLQETVAWAQGQAFADGFDDTYGALSARGMLL